MENERQVSKDESSKLDIEHFETSAKSATNVPEAFESMVKKALAREKKNKSIMPGPLMKGSAGGNVRLNQKKKPSKAKNACEC